MRTGLLAYEPAIRLAALAGVFVVMAAWEWIVPRRKQSVGRTWRWPNNLGVVVVDTLFVRVLFPTAAVGQALIAEAQGFGVFNMVAMPWWIAVVLSVVILDLAIYLQHVLFHAVPALWRLHRMHHADLDIDVTTGLRFHPIEIGLSISDQIRCHCRSGRTRGRGVDLRGSAQRHVDVQPQQRAHPGGN